MFKHCRVGRYVESYLNLFIIDMFRFKRIEQVICFVENIIASCMDLYIVSERGRKPLLKLVEN